MPLDAWPGYTVKTKTKLSDASWTSQPNLICESLVRGVSPTLDQAQLRWFYGTLGRTGDAALDYAVKLDLRGGFVRIEIPEWSVDWVGYVLRDNYTREGQESPGGTARVARGDQILTAVGLEYFLGRVQLGSSVIHSANTIDRSIGFNTGMGDGRDLSYALRGNKDSRSNTFAADFDHATPWTAKNAVDYLFANHPPRDKDGNAEPTTYQLVSAESSFLTWFKPTAPTEGLTLLQVLDNIIDHRRGLVWWIEYDDSFGVALVHVNSLATADISLPGSLTLPQNGSQASLGYDPRLRVRVTRANDRNYDVVVCRGARRRAVFTVSIESGNLEPAWKATEETAYNAGLGSDPDENDRYRQADRFSRVYAAFQIPAGWDGTSNDGAGLPGGTAYACPRPPQGSSTFGSGNVEKISLYGCRLLRTMPTKVGWDYDNATAPTSRDPANVAPEFQHPFAVVSTTDGWQFTHRLGEGGSDLTGYRLSVLAGTPGLMLNASGAAHCCALNHFDPDADGPTNKSPEVDYEAIRFTIAAEFDGYCEAVWPTTYPESDPLQTLYVYLGNRFRFDWLAAGTVYDCENGALKTVSTGGALQDDRDLCETMAKIAHQWYGVERASLSIDVVSIDGVTAPSLGGLITTVGTGAAAETVNAVVSQVTIIPARGSASISAGFTELDFAGLL